MTEGCKQCSNESVFLDLLSSPVISTLDDKVEPGHLFSCICGNCGPTVVDHLGWCLGECSEGHGDLPVPFTEVTVPNDYRLA